MAEEKIPSTERFDCGCVVSCSINDGVKTMTLEACEDETCWIRKYVIDESVSQGNDVVFGRKDITQ